MTDRAEPTSLAGRHALVTGASRGIGASVARALSKEGVRVHLFARSDGPLGKVADEVGGHVYPTDLSSPSAVERSCAAVRSNAGGAPDILVNAAGAFSLDRLHECDVDSFDSLYAVNVRAPFLLIRTFLGEMIGRGSGDIVNVGSIAGRKAFPENGAYAMSKFGLRGMHEVLVEELRGSGVRATLVEPGATDTTLWDEIDPDSDPNLPNRSEMLSPDDVAEWIRFLLTQPAHLRVPVLPIEPG